MPTEIKETLNKIFSKYIALAGTLVLLLSGSCSYEEEQPDPEPTLVRMPRISLNIIPLTLGVTSSEVTEMINSIRIVMLNEVTLEDGTTKNYIEYNQYFYFNGDPENGDMFSGPGQAAATFRWIITRNSVPGLKKFYLIANENKVNNIKFQTNDIFPNGIEEGMSLHDFLEHYGADYIENLVYPDLEKIPEKDSPKGDEFEKLVNCLYFTPDFTEIEQELSSGSKRKEIYLPYTSYYTYSLATQEDIDAGTAQGSVNILDGKMYLVPGANKFRFRFQNYRSDPVVIPSFKLGGMATNMYLFAQVEGDDLNKDFGAEKQLWWVDWLSKVAIASSQFEDPEENLGFSSAYGWINEYSIPTNAISETEGEIMDEKIQYGIVELVPEKTPWQVPANTSGNPVQGPPGEMQTGYFYFPESRYMITEEEINDEGDLVGYNTVQAYFFKIAMISGPNGSLAAVKDSQIGNLGSMFRDTNTYITIKMRDALDVGAYAQLEPWQESHTNGTVIEEEVNE